jgi:hypothetical protein
MTKYRIKWRLEGESVVREAHDAEQAQGAVEESVGRGGWTPFRHLDGTEVEHERWHFARDSTSAEDG